MANPNPNKATRFKKGEGGRKKGSRNKLTKVWLKTLLADFDEDKKEIVKKLRDEHLPIYARLIGALVPKDLDVKHSGDVTIQIVDYQDESEEE